MMRRTRTRDTFSIYCVNPLHELKTHHALNGGIFSKDSLIAIILKKHPKNHFTVRFRCIFNNSPAKPSYVMPSTSAINPLIIILMPFECVLS